MLARSGVADAAERSIRAGADLILMTGSASWNDVFPHLLAEARRDPAFRERIRDERRPRAGAEATRYSAEPARSAASSMSSRCTERVPPVRRVHIAVGTELPPEGVVGQAALERVLELRAQRPGPSTGASSSTRVSRLRGMRSGEPSQ